MLAINGAFAHNEQKAESIDETFDKFHVVTNRFWSNWFVTSGVGVQVYAGEHNQQISIGKLLSPALDISVGKWFTPDVGIRMTYSGLFIKGATQSGAHATGPVFDISQGLSYQEFNFGNLHADVMLNLTNLFCGYDVDRFYSISPYFGLGWMHTWDNPLTHEVSANAGIIHKFRLSSALDLNLDIRGTIVNERFDGEVGGTRLEGLMSATLGLTYKFKQRDWKRRKTTKIPYCDGAELNSMREKLNESHRNLNEILVENESLKLKLARDSKNVTEKSVLSQQAIFFSIGKANLSNESRVNLGFLAKVILENDIKSCLITGYADNLSGSVSLNESLSRRRAQAVYDCLVNEYNVPASVLRIHYKGGVDNMFFNEAALSRVVITEQNHNE